METDLIATGLLQKLSSGELDVDEYEFLLEHENFQHKPASITEFIKSEKYLNDKDCWPEVLRDLQEIFPETMLASLKMSPYSEIIRDMGIGSGKSFRIRYIFLYAVYRLLCRKDPQGDYGLARDSKIALINASVTGHQAKQVVFGEVSSAIRNSPWFQQNAMPDPNIMSELRFPKNIIIFPGSSSETAPLGYNIFVGNIDEAAFFTDSDSRDVAQEIYDALYNRELSRFSEHGMITAISSPRYVDDFVERKIEESKSNPSISGKVGPTWDNNPKDIEAIANGDCFKLQHPRLKEDVSIPSKYASAFRRNPSKAWRDFGAVASLALDPYFTDDEQERIRIAVESGQPNDPTLASVRVTGAPYFVHIDLGIVRDACGFAMGHVEDGRVVIDVILRIVCEARAIQLSAKGQPFDLVFGKQQVPIDEVREIVYRLSAMGFFIKCVSYDAFQSIDSRQILESRGYETKLISVDKDMKAYDTMKDLVNTNRFLSCQHNFFVIECNRLELKEGKKVDHPAGGSKDCADAVAGVCRSIAESFDEIVEEEEIFIDDSMRIKIQDDI